MKKYRRMKLSKIFVIVFALVLFFLIPFNGHPHPGGTDQIGCHTCRTNCTESWGIPYGFYHRHHPVRPCFTGVGPRESQVDQTGSNILMEAILDKQTKQRQIGALIRGGATFENEFGPELTARSVTAFPESQSLQQVIAGKYGLETEETKGQTETKLKQMPAYNVQLQGIPKSQIVEVENPGGARSFTNIGKRGELTTFADETPKPTSFTETKLCSVIRVIDGDTFECSLSVGNKEIIRLIGVDTPETKHPTKAIEYYGNVAEKYTRETLTAKQVRLELDIQARDKYGRLLAYVYLSDGTFFNALLVQEGYAQVSTVPPNVKYQDLFLKLQRDARENNRGLWN